jgi:hypothetical protein
MGVKKTQTEQFTTVAMVPLRCFLDWSWKLDIRTAYGRGSLTEVCLFGWITAIYKYFFFNGLINLKVKVGIVCKLDTDVQKNITKLIFELWDIDFTHRTSTAPIGKGKRSLTMVCPSLDHH